MPCKSSYLPLPLPPMQGHLGTYNYTPLPPIHYTRRTSLPRTTPMPAHPAPSHNPPAWRDIRVVSAQLASSIGQLKWAGVWSGLVSGSSDRTTSLLSGLVLPCSMHVFDNKVCLSLLSLPPTLARRRSGTVPTDTLPIVSLPQLVPTSSLPTDSPSSYPPSRLSLSLPVGRHGNPIGTYTGRTGAGADGNACGLAYRPA